MGVENRPGKSSPIGGESSHGVNSDPLEIPFIDDILLTSPKRKTFIGKGHELDNKDRLRTVGLPADTPVEPLDPQKDINKVTEAQSGPQSDQT